MKRTIPGAGGYGRVIADIAGPAGRYEKIRLLDDNNQYRNIPGKCGDFDKNSCEQMEVYSAFGNTILRMKWLDNLKKADAMIATIIPPMAHVGPIAVVGTGSAVLPPTTVNGYTVMG